MNTHSVQSLYYQNDLNINLHLPKKVLGMILPNLALLNLI
jgi:hypothetical protein